MNRGPRNLAWLATAWVVMLPGTQSAALAQSRLGVQPDDTSPPSSIYDTWDTPPPLVQLNREARVIPWGKGLVFPPAMSNSESEPPYALYRDNELLEDERMGRSTSVPPGGYVLRWGSGDLTQRLSRSIEVQRGHATVIDPDWSGLVVSVIDESRTTVGYSYEVVRLPDFVSFGVGRSAEEALGEKQRTWILSPGSYKVIPVGEDYNTIVNFATVRLVPGELTHLNIVIDEVSENFLGAGTLIMAESKHRGNTWRTYAATHANLLFDHQSGGAEGNSQEDLSFSGTGEFRLSHDSDRYNFLARGLFEEGISWIPEVGWRIIVDRFLARAVAIRKIGPRVGLYGRLLAESKLFPGRVYLDSPTEYVRIDGENRIAAIGLNDHVSISPSGLPLTIQEGVGLNLIALSNERVSLYIRSGYGFRQTINREVFTADDGGTARLAEVGADTLVAHPGSTLIYSELPSISVYGLEESLIGEARLGRRILLGAEADLLLPQDGGHSVIDAEATATLRLTKGISLYYELRFLDDPAISESALVEGALRLRFSHIF